MLLHISLDQIHASIDMMAVIIADMLLCVNIATLFFFGFVFFLCLASYDFVFAELAMITSCVSLMIMGTITSSSSSVCPGTFVACPEGSLLKRYHDCFPCNKIYIVIMLAI